MWRLEASQAGHIGEPHLVEMVRRTLKAASKFVQISGLAEAGDRLLILEVLNGLAFFADVSERVDADGEVDVGPISVDAEVAFAGLDAFRREGLVGDKKEG